MIVSIFAKFGLMWLYMFSILLAVFRVDSQIATPVINHTIYYNYTFIDSKGILSEIIEEPFAIEFLVTGLGFGEGPKWIQDCNYANDGYMLVSDQYSNCIWKYYPIDKNGNNYDIKCIAKFGNEKPNAVAWNLNFPDEIFVALQDGHAVVRLNLTQLNNGNFTELNRFNQSIEGYPLINVNDVVEDAQGNVYFSNYPFDKTDSSIIAGSWKISRDASDPNNFTVSLIEQLNYGTNGISLTLDSSLLVVANSMDFPAGVFNGGSGNQVNYSNLFWRGYIDFSNDFYYDYSMNFTNIEMFDYLSANKAPDAFTINNNADGSAFDFDDNYWQSMINGSSAEGYAVIVNPIKYGNNNSAIIGFIDFTGTGRGPTNFAKGMDGYMYITLTQWNNGGWGTGGALARIKLKNYLTNQNDGDTSDYVLDCSNSGTGTGTGTDNDDSGNMFKVVGIAVFTIFVSVSVSV